MRFLTIILLSIASAVACGCRSQTSLQCQRETALLRAEILDLEDKYYALKSQYRDSITDGSQVVNTGGVIGSGVVTSPVYIDSSQGYPTPVIMGDGVVYGEPVYGGVMQQQIIQGDVIYEDQMMPGTAVPPTLMQPAPIAEPVPTLPTQESIFDESESAPFNEDASPSLGSDSRAMSLETPKFDEATADPLELMLPENDVDLEVGHKELQLDFDAGQQQIDRLVIVSSATRGKDLDGIPGDDGIELMVQTLNADGDFVDFTGEMTITVQDRLAGEIGKWTFLPQELKLFLSRDELGNMGTLLHLPWTGKIPVSQTIEARVSVVIDNIEYIAKQAINIRPPTGPTNSPAVVGWGDDNRWVSVPNSSRQNFAPSSNYASPPRFKTSRPQASIERPQWKPVR